VAVRASGERFHGQESILVREGQRLVMPSKEKNIVAH